MAATDERQTLTELSEQHGWQHREADRADVFTRGDLRVRVIWQGGDKMSGATYYEDGNYEAYTREPNQVRNWLTR
jgi:hypothetical protein